MDVITGADRIKRGHGKFLRPSWDSDVEGGARDVILPPLDHQDVVAMLFQLVGHAVFQVALVFDQNLMTGEFWAINTHQEHVVTWGKRDRRDLNHRCNGGWCCKTAAAVLWSRPPPSIYLLGHRGLIFLGFTILTCIAAVNVESVHLAHQGFAETRPVALDLAGVGTKQG